MAPLIDIALCSVLCSELVKFKISICGVGTRAAMQSPGSLPCKEGRGLFWGQKYVLLRLGGMWSSVEHMQGSLWLLNSERCNRDKTGSSKNSCHLPHTGAILGIALLLSL